MENKLLMKLTGSAVDEAVKGNWKEAIKLNEEILKINEESIDPYLRIGYAHMQLNEYNEAKEYYLKAIKIQSGNQIAKNNLEKIKILTDKNAKPSKNKALKDIKIDPNLFLNVLGKTKILNLVNIGHIEVLVQLTIGEEVFMKEKKRRIEVRTKDNEYIGAFPDDLSKRIIFFLKNKSEYTIYVKEATKNYVEVFIKEIKKGKKVAKYISFPKDVQDNMKLMVESEEANVEETDEEAVPVIDLEKLAEEIAEKESNTEEDAAHFEEEKDEFDE
jgi:tetratricopeptide (TPR) repeat protein